MFTLEPFLFSHVKGRETDKTCTWALTGREESAQPRAPFFPWPSPPYFELATSRTSSLLTEFKWSIIKNKTNESHILNIR